MSCLKSLLDELKDLSLTFDVFGEFLGTFLLLFIGTSSFFSNTTPERVGATFGVILVALITIFKDRGGCHLNPAITIAHLIGRRVGIFRCFFYIIAQHCGSILGTLAINRSTNHSYENSVNEPGISDGYAVFIEGLLTFILVLIIFTVTSNPNFNGCLLSLVIGTTVLVFHIGFMEKCGASMNPARSFGPAVLYKKTGKLWIYYAGPIAGALIGSMVYDLILASDPSMDKVKKYFTNPQYPHIAKNVINTVKTEL